MTTWPDWFPPNCPPPSASAASGTFYRLVEEPTVKRDDFRSLRELFIQGVKKRQYWPDDQECKAVALSIHSVIGDAEATRRAIGPLRKHRIAEGEIDGEGRVLPTPGRRGDSHHSWWMPVDDAAWRTFGVVA